MIKVGDQVTVYDAGSYPLPVRGTVTKTTKTTCDVRTADGSMWSGFKKQCRRLKKKPRPPKERVEAEARKWLADNDWDYQKYGDRRPDRSAYDTMMRYEISDLLEWAFLAGARSRDARIKELEAHLEGARNSAGVTALEVENASLRAALEQVKAERDELKVENAEIWAKCPNEEWECTKIQRRLERRIASLEEGLREIANHCEHDQEGPGELCDCSTHMSLRARALLAAGEKAGGENG